MIPKVVHWCWFSKDPFPKITKLCLDSWSKHLQGYQIQLWDLSKIQPIINEVPFVKQSIESKKWAFASDYIRAYALYSQGGIYLDSDIFIRKNFDFVLSNKAFSAIENFGPGNLLIQSAFLGSEKGHQYFKDILDYYKFLDFSENTPISPKIYLQVALNSKGELEDKDQLLENGLMIYDSKQFASNLRSMNIDSYLVHCCNHSWKKDTPTHREFVEKCQLNKLKSLI